MRLNFTKIFLLLIITFSLISCVSKSEHEELKSEKANLEMELENIKNDYNSLYEENNTLLKEKRQAETERNKKKYYSESLALSYLKDHYEFYNNDMRYRNAKIRRVDDNAFKVSLEECTKKGDFSNNDFFWKSAVYNLVISNNGKYDFSRSF